MGGPKEAITHAQRVCRLYKKAYRVLENWEYGDRAYFRFKVTLLRNRFDETRKITDMRVLAKMVEDGEYECWENQHYDPKIFKRDPGGIVYQRPVETLDWHFDQWHPWERVQYMDFFSKRDQLKKDYNEYYEKSLAKKYQPEAPIN